MGVWKVQIIESERGWGQKVDETKEFKTFEEARKFQKDFNKPNEEDYAKTKFVPVRCGTVSVSPTGYSFWTV